MLLTCRANYPRTYRSLARQQQFLTDISQRCSSHSNIVLQLRSALVTDQIIQFNLAYSDFTFTGKLQIEIRETNYYLFDLI